MVDQKLGYDDKEKKECDQEHGCADENPHIFVNHRRFEKADGVKRVMTVEEIAKLAGIPPEIAVVRRYHGHHCSDPMHGEVEIVSGDQYTATRKKVDGGKNSGDRIDTELEMIKEGGGQADRLPPPGNAVIFYALPVLGKPELGLTDVMVPIPSAYPAQAIDHAFLPSDSKLIGRVKGSPQEVISIGGRQWRKISYHPHGNGGAGPWNPQKHGFHTYLGEILSWLGDIQ